MCYVLFLPIGNAGRFRRFVVVVDVWACVLLQESPLPWFAWFAWFAWQAAAVFRGPQRRKRRKCRSWESSNSSNDDKSAASSDLPPPPVDNDGEGDNGDDNSDAYAGILLAAGRTIDALPVDVAQAIKSSSIPPNMLSRYLELSKNSLVVWLLQFPGFRERLMGDPALC